MRRPALPESDLHSRSPLTPGMGRARDGCWQEGARPVDTGRGRVAALGGELPEGAEDRTLQALPSRRFPGARGRLREGWRRGRWTFLSPGGVQITRDFSSSFSPMFMAPRHPDLTRGSRPRAGHRWQEGRLLALLVAGRRARIGGRVSGRRADGGVELPRRAGGCRKHRAVLERRAGGQLDLHESGGGKTGPRRLVLAGRACRVV